MKKLVTIVSAVMMLLMLAACAPSLSIDAAQMKSITLGEKAIGIISTYAGTHGESKDGGVTFTAKEAIDVDDDTVIAANTTYTTSVDGDTAKLVVDGTVTFKLDYDKDETAEEYTVAVSFEGTMTTTDDGTAISYDHFTVDGEGFVPALCTKASEILAAL